MGGAFHGGRIERAGILETRPFSILLLAGSPPFSLRVLSRWLIRLSATVCGVHEVLIPCNLPCTSFSGVGNSVEKRLPFQVRWGCWRALSAMYRSVRHPFVLVLGAPVLLPPVWDVWLTRWLDKHPSACVGLVDRFWSVLAGFACTLDQVPQAGIPPVVRTLPVRILTKRGKNLLMWNLGELFGQAMRS